MLEILNNILSRITNFISVLTNELTPIFPYEKILGGLLWFFALYFISRWFKAYIIRVILFIMGIALFYDVMGRSHITSSVDFYASLGLFIPHISMVELTYLIIKERTLFLVDKVIEIFLLLMTPFIWIYTKFSNVFQFLQVKQEKKKQQKAKEDFYQEEFKREQARARAEEQKRYDEADIREQKKREAEQKAKKKEEYQEPTQEEPRTYSRWDSSNPYEVLGVSQNSSKQEIKKAYRNLCKIYHPDLTFNKKDEYTVILQKINGAYGILK